MYKQGSSGLGLREETWAESVPACAYGAHSAAYQAAAVACHSNASHCLILHAAAPGLKAASRRQHPPDILNWGREACGLGPSPGPHCVQAACSCCRAGAWRKQQHQQQATPRSGTCRPSLTGLSAELP